MALYITRVWDFYLHIQRLIDPVKKQLIALARTHLFEHSAVVPQYAIELETAFKAIKSSFRLWIFKYFPFLCSIKPDLLSNLQEQEISESSSVGRARPCQGRGREFESRLSLQCRPSPEVISFIRLFDFALTTYDEAHLPPLIFSEGAFPAPTYL